MQSVHPIEPKSPRTGLKIAVLLCAGLLLLCGGLAGGYWFARNFEIVRKGEPQAIPAEYGATSAPAVTQPGQEAARQAMVPDSGTEASGGVPTAPALSRGPFSYRFVPGEKLSYAIKTKISGEGMELLAPSGVLMDMDSRLTMTTKSVDRAGNGTLQLVFEDTSMEGDFMDSPFAMQVSPGQASITQGDKQVLDTEQGLGSTQGIPQLGFFQAPITMKVAPGGKVLSVSNSQGLAAMLTAAPSMASIEFPPGQLEVGDQWESDIALPVPGFGQAVRSHIVNTLIRYDYVGDRLCGVVEQQFSAAQADGTVNVPESSLGEAMQLSMPIFQLKGTNLIYFDTDQGHLTKTDMDLDLIMNLAQMFGGSGGMLGELVGGLGPLLGGGGLDGLLDQAEGRAPRNAPQQNTLLELDLKIKGGMELLSE